MAKRKAHRNGKLTAATADRYDLYQQSVQDPGHEVEFFDRVYRAEFGRAPQVLREDFCAAAAVCAEWVRTGPRRKAIGVDIDPEPIEWGRQHNLSKLTDAQRKRVSFLINDVRDVRGPKADIVAGENFSYFIFKTRDELRRYFAAARRNLKARGMLVLDIMGGYEVIEEDRKEKTKQKGFTYVWEQARFDPITHDCLFYIHFHFKDGTKLKRAFEYPWRLWTIPEVRELLHEAGFKRVDVYWEGEDENGEGTGEFDKATSAPSEPSYVTYLVAIK